MSQLRIFQAIYEIERVAQTLSSSKVWCQEGQTLRTEAAVIRALMESHPAAAVAMTNPASQSSVEIESRAKGAPGITVKVYHADPLDAAQRATELYDGLVASYAEKVTAQP